MSKHLSLGKKGEDIAASYLINKGYEIIDRNWKTERLELDLIAKKDGIYVFIEVKTRSTSFYGNPEEAITKAKKDNILEAVELYLEEKNIDSEIRIDVVTLILKENSHSITHLEDAILPYD